MRYQIYEAKSVKYDAQQRINTKYEKDIYVYRMGRFILLKDTIPERKYLNAPLSPKHKKKKKPKKNQQMPSKKKKIVS